MAGLPSLVAAAMADDGTLYVATADQQLAFVPAYGTKLATVAWPSEWSGTVVTDSLSVVPGGGGGPVVIAQRSDDTAWLRILDTNNMAQRKSFRLAGVPQGVVLTLWPFAYYTIDRTIRHIDLTSGVLETMAEVGEGSIARRSGEQLVLLAPTPVRRGGRACCPSVRARPACDLPRRERRVRLESVCC